MSENRESQPGFWKLFSGSVRGFDSPRQLAMGLTLGAVTGFLPKENILVVGLLVFLVLSVSNLLTAAVACATTSLFSPMLGEVFRQTGQSVLDNEFVVVALSRFFEMPLAAWTQLDNPLVCGALAINIFMFLPMYLLCFQFFSRYQPAIEHLLTQSRLVNWILGYSPTETSR